MADSSHYDGDDCAWCGKPLAKATTPLAIRLANPRNSELRALAAHLLLCGVCQRADDARGGCTEGQVLAQKVCERSQHVG